MSITSRKDIPNQLTLLRLLFAAAFFAVLSFYYYGQSSPWMLPVSVVLFILAAVTDALDGHLARKWHVESTFGRIMDPFCDKVLILGAIAYLAGPGFTISDINLRLGGPIAQVKGQITGVYPWMVILIISRELLVTAIRGEVEKQGIKFGANWWGKTKMILQSIIVPIILLIVFAFDEEWIGEGALMSVLLWVRDGLVYATVIVTVVSGFPYIAGAKRALRASEPRG